MPQLGSVDLVSEWLEALGRSEFAAIVGVALLLLVAGVPIVPGRRAWPPVLGVLVGLAVGAFTLEAFLDGKGLVSRDSDISKHLKAGLETIRHNVRKPKKNLLIVGGGSYVAYGLDPNELEDRLRRRGYEAEVVHLAEPGANHFERRQLYRDLLDHPSSRLRDTPDGTRVVLLEEVQLQYDTEPVVQIGRNLGTARLSYYMTPRAAREALWALHFGGGKDQEAVDYLEWKVVRHALVRTFNVGAVDRLTRLERVKARDGFVPFRAAPFKFKGVGAARAATTGPLPEFEYPWLWEIREPGIEWAFDGHLDQWVYFAVPPTNARYVKHSRVFCQKTDKHCVPLDDPELYDGLKGRKFWHDGGHLSKAGARVFTRWLADELAQSGALRQ